MTDTSAESDTGPADPRFVLANERTYLAWMRTSLALVAAGLAVAHLLPETVAVAALWIGIGAMASGGLLAVLGHRRWRRVLRALDAGQPVPPTGLPLLLTVVLAAAAAGAVALAVAA